ncbi:hypothetical protein K2173_020945 [Erythroxylum novogranatense]|uniref:TRF2/HOY1 PH-like domain-containing protein n=1 Tax=Erythroxylum novogranatense TaxID=1862640 RepID=A0AAV8TP33_9ROSI|nr:hypothetical protein K2173_020945 [Erythroxylum novogranatense]
MRESGNLGSGHEPVPQLPVKREITDDHFEEEHGTLNKRSKTSQWGAGANAISFQYNPLDEPSPLGLRLRKSPSLLDLIQRNISQGSVSATGGQETEGHNLISKKESKRVAPSGTTDKLKASNFPVSILRIGSWERKAKNEVDLVAKCYFAKHKLVWEILEGTLKSKIEIQWSDIMDLKANCPDDGHGTLNVVLARQPLFFKETNPQPRKHTLWQATADFTNGQASIHRQHFLQCQPGLLNKHFEKLIQCDMRLNFLSHQPEKILDSPYFDQCLSGLEDPAESKDLIETGTGTSILGSHGLGSPAAAHSSSLENEIGDPTSSTLEHASQEAPSPVSGSGNCEAVNSRGQRDWNQIKVPGLHPSVSMTDLMNHIENCISGRVTSGNPPFSVDASECQVMLEDVAQYLLSDTQLTMSSDEKRLMSRVNSLCCLLQNDSSANQNLQHNDESCVDESQVFDTNELYHEKPDGIAKEVSVSKQAPGMSRKDSFGELMLHLPRIASLPSMFFNVSEEDCGGQGRR